MSVVNYIVAHKLFKRQNSEEIEEKIVDELIEIAPVSELFVTNFKQAHSVRKGVQHGRFIDDLNRWPVQKFVMEYCSETTPEKFLELSKKIGIHLRKCLKDDKRSAGGFLIVFDYTDESRGHIVAIALMADKADSGLDTNTLKFTKNMTLDLQHMHVATTIMIDRLLTANIDINYLTFMTGLRGLSEIYRKNFIGCDNVQLSAKATKYAIEAIESFLISEKHFDDAAMNEARNKIVKYFDDNPQEVSLQQMQNIVIPNPDDQEEFNDYIEQQQLELSASFKPNKKSYKSWKKFYYKESGIMIDIDASKVEDKTVTYYNEDHQLRIKDPTGDLYREYRKFVCDAELGD
ncbi:MAG: nucleoid-associated protein [Peptostreptococcaceae bacterium]|nr:nucleoid-associated protein [Peptostreptococcaceae bacterium]